MLNEEYKCLLQADLSLAAQRSKVTWLQEMESNTSYFHAKVKEKKHRGRVLSIQVSNGEILTEPSQIQNEFVQFYMALFGAEEEHISPLDVEAVRRGRILTDNEASSLCRPFTEVDVKEAVFGISNDKAPGPDGFSSYFYKATWDITGNDLAKSMLNFFQSGKILT